MDTDRPKVWELGLHQISKPYYDPTQAIEELNRDFNIKHQTWLKSVHERAEALNKLSTAQKDIEQWYQKLISEAPEGSYWRSK